MKSPNVLHVVVAFVVASFSLSELTGAPRYSSWSVPVNLGAAINSPYQDFGPAVSKNGLSLYFTSDRPGGFGSADLWVSQRASENESWGPPLNLGAVINTAGSDNSPAFSRDGHWMFFGSNRPGGFGQQDIWASWRPQTDDDFGWEPPFNLGATVNTPFNDPFPSYLEHDDGGGPLLFFSSNRPGSGGSALYVCELGPDGVFGPAALIPELNSTDAEQRPSVRFDGLEIIFVRNPPGMLFSGDLWVSSRGSISDPWSPPEPLLELNTASHDAHPYLGADRETLYFNSDRPGGFGLLDLYVTTRTKSKP